MTEHKSAIQSGLGLRGWLLALAPAVVVVLLVFHSALESNLVQFSNDGPLGLFSTAAGDLPGIYSGIWTDINWIGGEYPSAAPTLTPTFRWALGNVGFAKWYTPLSLVFLAGCAAFFARRLGANWQVAALAALAAALNSNFFSNACWGLASRPLTLGALFLCLAALWSKEPKYRWLRTVLAGGALGIGLMEGYDVGAIFSLYVAAFALFLRVIDNNRLAPAIGKGVLQVGLVAVCAALLAAQTMSTLVSTQVKGVVGMEQDAQTKEARWNEATQWSLPKAETLRVIIPGLYGYRMDTPEGGSYWGAVGQQPGWETHRQGIARYSGAGEYAGVLVVLVAAWTLLQACRGKQSVFEGRDRKIILFWAVAAFISLLLAYGRHAPFYRLFYSLPYVSTIRNPIKFLHPFHLGLLILFTYGLVGIWRTHLAKALAGKVSLAGQFLQWWRAPGGFDKKAFWGLLGLFGVSALGALMYAAAGTEMRRSLQEGGFGPEAAAAIFKFSLGEVGWYMLLLVLAIGLAALVLSGALAGPRAKWAMLLGFLLLTGDLWRANLPWIKYYDYQDRLVSNPVFDILRTNAYQHRVQIVPFQMNEALGQLQEFYSIEWKQHEFPFLNIQTLDIIQEPRRAADNEAYRAAFRSGNPTLMARLWELTNTRYLMGLASNFPDVLNQQLDPQKRRFRVHTPFTLVPKRERPTQYSDFTLAITTNGPFALIEFTGALPRAKLYTNWQVMTNGETALKELANPAFDPQQTVLISDPIPNLPAKDATNAGTVEFASYAPKHIQLNATVAAPSILLLNDKHHPDWKLWVDGQPAQLLRCNYLMRGVFLEPGKRRVEMRFQPSPKTFYISVGALGICLLLCGYLAWATRREQA